MPARRTTPRVDSLTGGWSHDGFERGCAHAADAVEITSSSVRRLELRTQSEGTTVRVIAHGEIDLSNFNDVTAALIAAESTPAGTIVLDLAAVTFIDSTGIRTLLEAVGRSRRDRNRLRIVPSRPVARLFALCGVQDLLPLNPVTARDSVMHGVTSRPTRQRGVDGARQ